MSENVKEKPRCATCVWYEQQMREHAWMRVACAATRPEIKHGGIGCTAYEPEEQAENA